MKCLYCHSLNVVALRSPDAHLAITNKLKHWQCVLMCQTCGMLWPGVKPDTMVWAD